MSRPRGYVIGEPLDEDDAALDAPEHERVARACDGLLEALREHEAWPERIPNPDCDRYRPHMVLRPQMVSFCTSPAAMCAEWSKEPA